MSGGASGPAEQLGALSDSQFRGLVRSVEQELQRRETPVDALATPAGQGLLETLLKGVPPGSLAGPAGSSLRRAAPQAAYENAFEESRRRLLLRHWNTPLDAVATPSSRVLLEALLQTPVDVLATPNGRVLLEALLQTPVDTLATPSYGQTFLESLLKGTPPASLAGPIVGPLRRAQSQAALATILGFPTIPRWSTQQDADIQTVQEAGIQTMQDANIQTMASEVTEQVPLERPRVAEQDHPEAFSDFRRRRAEHAKALREKEARGEDLKQRRQKVSEMSIREVEEPVSEDDMVMMGRATKEDCEDLSKLLTEMDEKGIDALGICPSEAWELKTHREVVLAAVQKRGEYLKHAPKKLKGDRHIVLAAVQQNGDALEFAAPKLKKDREIVLAAVQERGPALRFAAEELKEDRSIVLAAVTQNGNALLWAAKKLHKDHSIWRVAHRSESQKANALAAVQSDGKALQHTKRDLRRNHDIVFAAVSHCGLALEFASEELKRDRSIVLAAVRQDGHALHFAAKELLTDRDIVLTAVKQKGIALRYARSEQKCDRGIVWAACRQDGMALKFADPALRKDHAFVLSVVEREGFALQFVAEERKRDRDIVLMAVQKKGDALEFAPQELKDDKEIVLAAVKKTGHALKFASERLARDREIVLAAVGQDGDALLFAYVNCEHRMDPDVVIAAVENKPSSFQFAPPDLQENENIVRKAVMLDGGGDVLEFIPEYLQNKPKLRSTVMDAMKKMGRALQFASRRHQKDPEIVLAAVSNDGTALEFAARDLGKVKDIVTEAVKHAGCALEFASPELQKDHFIVLAAVRNDGDALEFAEEKLQDEVDIVFPAVKQKATALQFASERLKNHKGIVETAVRKQGDSLQFASRELRRDEGIVLLAVQQQGDALEFASDDLQKNKKVVEAAVEQNGNALQFASAELQKNESIVEKAVKQHGHALQFAADELRKCPRMVKVAVTKKGDALQFAAEQLQKDKEIVEAAVRQQGDALQFAHDELRKDLRIVDLAVAKTGDALQFAAEDLWEKCDGDDEKKQKYRQIVTKAVKQDGTAFQYACEWLRSERDFIEGLVKETKADWLLNYVAQDLAAQSDFKTFQKKCKQAAGKGLVFTYYNSFGCFARMRQSFDATCASVPGGEAYDRVMDEIRNAPHGDTATVWFGDELVFGNFADKGDDGKFRWVHPPGDCGRDDQPVPARGAPNWHPMWDSKVESRSARRDPRPGEKFKCWCCHWIREVRKHASDGEVICCAVSNIYHPDWVKGFGAGSSELSDHDAQEHGLEREVFTNGQPPGWGGESKIVTSDGSEFDRKASVHKHTQMPLGVGCRWERSVLDKLEFPVYAFFQP